jgi:hypothetical protein
VAEDEVKEKDENDRDVEGLLDGGMGYQYCLKMFDGSREWYRHPEKLLTVAARIRELQQKDLALELSGKKALSSQFLFPGVKATEGVDDAGAEVWGPTRGRGVVMAVRVVGLAYADSEAATALMATLRSSVEAFRTESAEMQAPGESPLS